MLSSLSGEYKDDFERGVLGVHFYNVAANWECTGLLEDDPPATDLLPPGWNVNRQLYSFRYKQADKKYQLKIIRASPTSCSIHGLRSDFNEQIFSSNIDLSNFLNSVNSCEFIALLDSEILQQYNREVLAKVKALANKPSQAAYGVPAHLPPPANPTLPYNPMMPAHPGLMDPEPLMGPRHPIFGQSPASNIRWDPINPFPDNFHPPEFNNPFGGPRGPFGGGGGFF